MMTDRDTVAPPPVRMKQPARIISIGKFQFHEKNLVWAIPVGLISVFLVLFTIATFANRETEQSIKDKECIRIGNRVASHMITLFKLHASTPSLTHFDREAQEINGMFLRMPLASGKTQRIRSKVEEFAIKLEHAASIQKINKTAINDQERRQSQKDLDELLQSMRTDSMWLLNATR